MHPQIRQPEPGQCPICGMDLVPLPSDVSTKDAVDPDEIEMTQAAMKLADVQTVAVRRGTPEKVLHLFGAIEPDEGNIAALTARFSGRIEILIVNFTGQRVKKGEKLGEIYSPELMTAQQELLEASVTNHLNPLFMRRRAAS